MLVLYGGNDYCWPVSRGSVCNMVSIVCLVVCGHLECLC